MSCTERCRAALMELESLGVEEWTAQHTAALREVVEVCPHCKEQWNFLQQSVLIVSTTAQVLPSPDQSRLMWQTCAAHIRLHPTSRGHEPRLDDIRDGAEAPSWREWFRWQPALGWAALGGAAVILAGVLFLQPAPQATGEPVVASVALPEIQPSNDLANMPVNYRRPPELASPLLNNHAMLGSGPFSNYVGPSLISYSAVARP